MSSRMSQRAYSRSRKQRGLEPWSRGAIRAAIEANLIAVDEDGSLDPAQADAALDGAPTDPDARDAFEAARARKMEADAAIREDQLRVSRGELIPLDQVLDTVRKPLEEVDGKLRSAPRRLAKDWSGRLGVTQAQAIALIGELTEEIRADLREVFEADS